MKGHMRGKQAGGGVQLGRSSGWKTKSGKELQPWLVACGAFLPPTVAALRHHRWAAPRDDLHAVWARQWEGCAGEKRRNPAQQMQQTC